MKALLSSLAFLSLPALAHPGHPGVSDHGSLTHLMLGLALSLPVLLGLIGLRTRARRRAALQPVRKQD